MDVDESVKLENLDTFEESKMNHLSPKSLPSKNGAPKTKKKISISNERKTITALWKQSSSSLTRDKAPAHKIPKAFRFNTMKDQQRKDRAYLTLNISKQINGNGIAFPKSNRPEHFLKVSQEDTPSPASYEFVRFMDDVKYKSKTQKKFNQTHATTNDSFFNRTGTSIRGISIPCFNAHHKSYVPHSKHRFYQPENTDGNPAPGVYNINWANKKNESRYSFRVQLKRFNETNEQIPGPSTYKPEKQERTHSLNAKGTFQKSNRTYLTKFEDGPSPNKYHITRFLQKYN